MTISVDISAYAQQRLETLAEKHGMSLEAYVRELIEHTALAGEPIDMLFAPFRDGFLESGMTEEQATDLLDSELAAVRASRRIQGLS